MNITGKAYLAVLAVLLQCLSGQASHAQLFTITPHDLLPEQKIVVDGEEVPQWKVLWDKARKSALQGDFDSALHQYDGLLVLKSNLEEARWEYARLLIYLKRWDEAGKLLELLIESEPDSTLFIISLGKVMWEMAQYERAVGLFKRVYKKNPTDQTALAGLVEGLIKLDKKKEALPYLEQLTRQEPTNRGVRRYLAFLLYETENYDKARVHLTILSRNEDVEFEILYKTAKTYERLGLEQQAFTYWERVLARQPDNLEANIFLAEYYENTEQLDRSLTHLQTILAQSPDKVALSAHLGETYEKVGDYGKALIYYEKHLEHYPDDHEVRQQLAGINATMEKNRQTRATFRDHYSKDDQRQTAKLKQTIRNHIAAGLYRETVPFYRQLLEISPPDHEILAALANDLIAIGENEGTLSMVGFLADIVGDDLSTYRSMAELFLQLEQEDELLAILHKMHELDPGDNFITQELAILYLSREELLLSRDYFSELSEYDCWNIPCLEARASLAEKLNLPAHRLQDYETLLMLQPNSYEIRHDVIALAAQMGLLDAAVFHAGYQQTSSSINEDLELKILLAEAYRASGYLSRAVARYGNILEQTSAQNDEAVRHFRIRSWLGIAESYKNLDLLYEAEQTLRTALVREEYRMPILKALFYLFLETGRIGESEIWLQAIKLEISESHQGDTRKANWEWQKEFLQAEMYGAAGEYELAVELYRQAEALLPEQRNNRTVPDYSGNEAPDVRIRKHMAENYLYAGEYAEAEQIVLGLQNSHVLELELLVLLEQIYRAWGKNDKADESADKARGYGAQDFGRQLALATLYRKYKDISGQRQAAEKAAGKTPYSLMPKLLLADAHIKQGKYITALELLDQFLGDYPENTWFLSQKAELLARVGSFQEALAVTEMILADNPGRPDISLLRARILWEMKLWKDSISQYESVVYPEVEETLEEKIQEQGLAVDLSSTRSSWWKVITVADGTHPSLSQVVMSPAHAIDLSSKGQVVNAIAAEHYALYRWQNRFNKELSVRRSVMRREYYHAANKLENLMEEYGDNDFLLYDLAGLYSKLERLGAEASLYRELEEQNAGFPGLADAVQRNNLKRRPQVFLSYTMLDDDGWNGYKSVRQKVVRGGGKYFQTTDHEWGLDVARIDYESNRDSESVLGWRTMLAYDAKLTQTLGLSLGGGFEKLENGYDDTPLLYGALTGKIADEMRAVFSAKQDVVADTIASLKRNIKKRNYKIELMFDLFPRLLLGGHYDFIDYSDDNWTQIYTLWASYILLPEPTQLQITYNYDFYDSHEGQKPGAPSDDGFASKDHPYWSPQNYWITRFSFYFKHQLSDDTLARGVPSYYTMLYSLGYDSDDNDLHELRASLNFEIAKNYTLSASFGYLDLDVYDQKEAFLSVMYRF